MIPLVSPELEAYAAAHSTPPSCAIQALAERTQREQERAQMMVGPLEGALLKMLVCLTGARRVLEIGMFTGYSALSMAEALPEDGEVVACELDPHTGAIAQSHFDRSPQGYKIRVLLGDARQTLAGLQGPFELAFIDAEKEHYTELYDPVLDKLPPGGLLVADNVLWSGAVLNPKTPSDHALVAFNRMVSDDERVDNVLLTVRDGVMLARKR